MRAPVLAGAYDRGGLFVAFAMLSPDEQVEQFNIVMKSAADVTPERMVVRNDGGSVLHIRSGQVLGRTAKGATYPAYPLEQTIRRVRRSRVGKAMASGAVTGMVVRVRSTLGAAAATAMDVDGGAAIAMAVGGGAATAGAAGRGTTLGAATARTGGGLYGAAAGADAASRQIAQELRKVNWGRRVVRPGDTERGYLFLRPNIAYEALDVLVYNVDTGETRRLSVTLN